MKPLVLGLALLLVVLVGIAWRQAARRQARAPDDRDWPFTMQRPLSRVEQALFHRLVRTLPEQIVLAQVSLSRFLRVRKGHPWREWQNRISQKSIDYLICERDFSIVAAIELDDASHRDPERARSDMTKTRALAAARIPLLRWQVAALPDAAAIRAIVAALRRERFGDVGAVTPEHAEPSAGTSRIDASNDPTMFHEENRQ